MMAAEEDQETAALLTAVARLAGQVWAELQVLRAFVRRDVDPALLLEFMRLEAREPGEQRERPPARSPRAARDRPRDPGTDGHRRHRSS
jgi:hypothetical protein